MNIIDYTDKENFDFPKNVKNMTVLLTKNKSYIYFDINLKKGWYSLTFEKSVDDSNIVYEITQEYNNMRGLKMVNAIDAYNRGATGKNILIGIVDSGIDHDHKEFIGKVSKGIDFSENNFLNPHYHGSHVAGISAAKREKNNDEKNMHGYAFNSDLLDIRVFDSNGNFVLNDSNNSRITDLVFNKNVNILNRSYGLTGWFSDGYFNFNKNYSVRNYEFWYPYSFQSYKDIVEKEIIQVWAGGNDGYKELGVESALGTIFPELKKIWCSAVSVDANGNETFYSNRAGKISAPYTITTFGGGINDGGVNSTGSNNDYISSIGTSMAAPALSGCLAIVMSRFRGILTNYECLLRLFETASYDKLSIGFHIQKSGSKKKVTDLLNNYQKNPNINKFIEIKKLILGNNFESNKPNVTGGKNFPPSKFDYFISAKILTEKLSTPYDGWNDYNKNPATYLLFAIFGHGLIDLEKATRNITKKEISKLKKFDEKRTSEILRISRIIHRKYKHLIYKKNKIRKISFI